MRMLMGLAVLALVAGCGSAASDPVTTPSATFGSGTLAGLCPQVHRAIDVLVVSRPSAQLAFVEEIQRIMAAGTRESQSAIEPLLAAGRTLAAAGTGPNYRSALQGIYPAQVAVNDACQRVGSPILHQGH